MAGGRRDRHAARLRRAGATRSARARTGSVLRPPVRLSRPTRRSGEGVLFWDGQGLCLFAKRLERGRFIWPAAKDGVVTLTPAQLSMLLEGIDWRMPARSWQPEMAG